jgi:hypothetical protein
MQINFRSTFASGEVVLLEELLNKELLDSLWKELSKNALQKYTVRVELTFQKLKNCSGNN